MIHFQNLVLPSNFKSREFGQLTKKKRIDLVNEAISWKGDTSKGSYITEWLWTSPDANNRVGLGKFGKKFYLVGVSPITVKLAFEAFPNLIM